METATTKIELAKLILDIENPALLNKIHNLVVKEQGDFWDTLSDQEKKEIKLGISQLNDGQRTSFDEYLEKVS